MLQKISARETRLPDIPVLDVGTDFAFETLVAEEDRAHALIDSATKLAPRMGLRGLDAVSRRWLKRWSSSHLDEIDRIAARLARPGAYFLAVNYEWGCTCRVGPSPDGTRARLIRVLDWRTPGLGRHIIAARVKSAVGSFMTLTWPGYTGVLQANAPGRFAAALNQAPMRRPLGLYPLDWAANRARVWRMPHPTPAHLLREVFETAKDFDEAKTLLKSRAIAAPAIFLLAGVLPKETAVIERTEEDACVHGGDQVAANHWQAAGWSGHARGIDSAGRARQISQVACDMDPAFSWLKPPILNDRTRLVMMADAADGRLVAQGYEADVPATNVLTG